MTRVLTVAAAILLSWLGTTLADQPQGSATDSLEGVWKLESVELNGQPLSMELLKDARLTVRGAQYLLNLGDIKQNMNHVMHPELKPKTMDMTIVEGDDKGKTVHAIYKLEGDKLTVCRHLQPDMPRPTEFGTKPDSGLLLVVWTRDKS